jgi:hypothetical protein
MKRRFLWSQRRIRSRAGNMIGENYGLVHTSEATSRCLVNANENSTAREERRSQISVLPLKILSSRLDSQFSCTGGSLVPTLPTCSAYCQSSMVATLTSHACRKTPRNSRSRVAVLRRQYQVPTIPCTSPMSSFWRASAIRSRVITLWHRTRNLGCNADFGLTYL